eukprot:13178468-Ditylum_brightwellii.AAC.1
MSSTRQNGQSGGSDGGDITPGIFASSVAELNIHTNNSNNNENEDDDDKDQTKIIYCYTDGAMEALKPPKSVLGHYHRQQLRRAKWERS